MRIRPTRIHLFFLLFILTTFTLQLGCSKDKESFLDAVIEKPEVLIEEQVDESSENQEDNSEENHDESLENRTTSFPTIHDAHLQSGKGYNQRIIRLQEDFRTSYLMFDLSPITSIEGKITAASLQFTIDLDDGNGNITVHSSKSNEWSETDLSAESAPEIDVELGSIIKEYTVGSTEIIELSIENLLPQTSTLILVHKGGDDLAFASKEHADKIGPKLVVNYTVPVGTEEIEIVSEEDTTEEDTTEEDTSEEDTTEEDTSEEDTTEEDTTEEDTTEEDTSEEDTTEEDTTEEDTTEEDTTEEDEENTEDTSTNEEPIAIADATPSSGGVPLVVTFKGDNSSDDKAIASYFWDFKDGSTATNANPSHTFTEVGTYQVELTVKDNQELSSSDVVNITVTEKPNSAPIAKVSGTPLTGEAPLQVLFKGSDSTDDISISSYTWDYKDGSTENKADTSHTFTEAGTYNVELTVKDENGLSDKETISITVSEPSNEAPVAVLTATPSSGNIPLQVQFTGDKSTDDTAITSYVWDFKNGSTATNANPLQTFTEAGTYIVELTVTDADGLSDKKSVTITASAPQNEAPVAIASANTTSGNAPLEVRFVGNASTDDNVVTSYLWQFKDGQQNSTSPNPAHTFMNPGNYAVELTVEDAAGLTSTTTINIIVNTPDTGNAPEGSYYVTTSGSASNDGLSEATAWNIEHAFQNAQAGDHVFIKAGNYGNVKLQPKYSGNAGNPIRFIGYKNAPGDVQANNGSTFHYGETVDPSRMPLLKGNRINNAGQDTGIFSFVPYVEFSNFQITDYNVGIYTSGIHNILDNIIVTEIGDKGTADYTGRGVQVDGDYSIIKNCIVVNSTAEGFYFGGTKYQKHSYNKVYSDFDLNATDYYYLLLGGPGDVSEYNELDNIYVERVGDLGHPGHGLILKFDTQNNTIRNSTVKNCWFEFSYSGVFDNEIIDCNVIGGANKNGSLLIANGAHHNTFTNLNVQNCDGVSFADWDEAFDRGDVKNAGHHNQFKNCNFDNNLTGINFWWWSQETPESPAHDNVFDNCTFSNMEQLFMIDRVNMDNVIKNSTIRNIQTLKNSYYPTLNSDRPLNAIYQNNTLENCGFTLN